MHIEPYLMFNGRCEEAIEFYRRALGAQDVMMMRFKENPDPEATKRMAPGSENKIMHAAFRVGDSLVMASDGENTGQPVFQGVSLTLNVANEAEAKQRFNALSDGGQVRLPLTKTFYSPSFGMVADRFGVSWMVIVPQ